MSFERNLYALIVALRRPAPAKDLFNPYVDDDPDLDRPGGHEIRRSNLCAYLRAHEGARYVLVGEAPGYRGCRFSGVPFTSEQLILGEAPLPWTAGCDLRRSSLGRSLWWEASAEVVWEGVRERRDCVLWNTVPWHPHNPSKPLSNRGPNRYERVTGLAMLPTFLALFPAATTVAIGRIAEGGLKRIGMPSRYIRHPSYGGKSKFLAGIAELN